MALSVIRERTLWLNLLGVPDSKKRCIAGAPVVAGQALFGPAVALMQQRCDIKKKEDEAFKLSSTEISVVPGSPSMAI